MVIYLGNVQRVYISNRFYYMKDAWKKSFNCSFGSKTLKNYIHLLQICLFWSNMHLNFCCSIHLSRKIWLYKVWICQKSFKQILTLLLCNTLHVLAKIQIKIFNIFTLIDQCESKNVWKTHFALVTLSIRINFSFKKILEDQHIENVFGD